jgi:hypothetical protein
MFLGFHLSFAPFTHRARLRDSEVIFLKKHAENTEVIAARISPIFPCKKVFTCSFSSFSLTCSVFRSAQFELAGEQKRQL